MSDNPSDLRERFPALLRDAFDISPPPGWVPLVARLLERVDAALASEDRQHFRISQIKEKFGGLRCYHNGGEDIETMVDAADEEAQRTCEVCGAPGRKRTGGWITVRCDKHAEV
ncbi:hypothetical protein VQ042_22160 [Aurantimonas sp. A2-1-M11]|uniref:hypothetical protein n=1 Tax=Aurantimonas sp. A2-1-M11 TaxID=3113712 RepID=UPI002F94F0BF